MNYETPMDLRRLRYFAVVAEELNFSRAAERLHMAQPPLSNQIKQLETDLGVSLFDRTGRGVRLTEAGRVLLEETRRTFIQLDQTARMVERVSSGRVGRLSIGFVPSASNEVLPEILHEFRRRFPEVELLLQEMKPDAVARRLQSKQLDVGFFYLPFEDGSLQVRSVVREPFIVALPEGHRLSRQAEVGIKELRSESFILPMRHQMPGLYAQVLEVCRKAGFVPQAVQKDVWLMQTIVGLVAGGMGIALVPASLRNFHRKGVTYKPIRNLPPTVETGMVWRAGDISRSLEAFLEVAEEVSRQWDFSDETQRELLLQDLRNETTSVPKV